MGFIPLLPQSFVNPNKCFLGFLKKIVKDDPSYRSYFHLMVKLPLAFSNYKQSFLRAVNQPLSFFLFLFFLLKSSFVLQMLF